MKEKSSNETMKASIELLETIKKTEVSDELYGCILQKIEYRKKSVIQPVWGKVAAVLLAGLIATEFYFISQALTAEQTTAIETMVPIPDNMLYE